MQAYETGMKSGDTRMVLTPDSEFFRYLNNPGAGLPRSDKQTAGGMSPARFRETCRWPRGQTEARHVWEQDLIGAG